MKSTTPQSDVARAMHALLQLSDTNPASLHASTSHGRIHYLEAGTGASVVLLLHGGSGGGANWYRLIGPLARSHRVLAPDLPGFGLSSALPLRPPLGGHAAEILDAFLEVLHVDSCHVVGTSFGGLAAARLAQRSARVKRVVLIDSAGFGRSIPGVARLCASPLGGPLMTPTRAGTRWLLRTWLTAERLPAAEEEALVDYLWRSAAGAAPRAMHAAMQRFAGLLGQREVLSDRELQSLASRCMVIWGERDRFLSVRQVERWQRVAASETHILSGVGHSPNWEAPDRVLALILPFLARSAAA